MPTKKEARTVDIHGKKYELTASRIERFRDDHPEFAISTELLHTDEKEVIFKATVTELRDGNPFVLATGHAIEKWNSSNINKTSALENCETSAIGRALACYGYLAGGEFASADEVSNAIRQQSDPEFHTTYMDAPAKTLSGNATDKQIELIELKTNQLKAGSPPAYKEFGDWYKKELNNLPFKALTKAQASLVIDQLLPKEEELF